MIAFQEWGNRQGKPIVALHGWLDNSATYLPLVPHLEKTFHLHAPDLPGHGESGHTNHPGLPHFLDWVGYLRTYLESKKLSSKFLMGHSMGGAIALLYAAIFPEEVEAVICLDSLGPFTAEADVVVERAREYFDKKKLLELKPERPIRTIDEMIERKMAAAKMPREIAKAIVARDSRTVDGGFVWRHEKGIRLPTPLRLTEAQVRIFLSALKCKVLLLEADDNDVRRATFVRDRKALVSKLESHRVGGSHYFHSEKPKEVSELIARFLNG